MVDGELRENTAEALSLEKKVRFIKRGRKYNYVTWVWMLQTWWEKPEFQFPLCKSLLNFTLNSHQKMNNLQRGIELCLPAELLLGYKIYLLLSMCIFCLAL